MTLRDHLKYLGFDPLAEGRTPTYVTDNILVFVRDPHPTLGLDPYCKDLERRTQTVATVTVQEIPDPLDPTTKVTLWAVFMTLKRPEIFPSHEEEIDL